jgi:ABC-type phosphate transport system substrate-binding protein
MRRRAAIAAALLLAATTAAADGGYKVIVNPANPTRQLTRAALANLFLKRNTTWQNGSTVQPVEPAAGPVHEKFCAEVLGKSAAAVRTYWTRLTFAGRDTPPVEKNADDEVVSFVRNTPGAIGYVSESTSSNGVATVTVTE